MKFNQCAFTTLMDSDESYPVQYALFSKIAFSSAKPGLRFSGAFKFNDEVRHPV